MTAYTVAFGGFLLLGARSADLFGRRRMLVGGLAVFTVGSLAAGLAASFEQLLAGRALQGVGAAATLPIALSLINVHYEEGPARNRAIAVYSAISGAGLALGLLIGGAVTDWLSWRWILLVNVPIGLLLIAATTRWVSESPRSYGHLDVIGALTSTAGLTGLVYGFVHAGSDGWADTETISVLGASVALLAAFVLYEAFLAAAPILPLRLFSDRNRSAAYVVILVAGASLFGLFYVVTFFAQGVLGYSALKTGVAFLPAALVLIASAQLSATLLPRFGPKPLIVAGTVLLTAALLLLSTVTADSGYLDTVLPGTLAVGLGLGAIFVPLTAVVMSRITDADAAAASAVLTVGQQVGGAIGLAVLASSVSTTAASAGQSEGLKLVHQYGLSEHLIDFIALAKALQAVTEPAPAVLRDAIARHAIDGVQATADGAAFQTAAIFGAVAILVSVLGLRRSARRTEAEPTSTAQTARQHRQSRQRSSAAQPEGRRWTGEHWPPCRRRSRPRPDRGARRRGGRDRRARCRRRAPSLRPLTLNTRHLLYQPSAALVAKIDARVQAGYEPEGDHYPTSGDWPRVWWSIGIGAVDLPVVAVTGILVAFHVHLAWWFFIASLIVLVGAAVAAVVLSQRPIHDPLRLTTDDRRELNQARSWQSRQPWMGPRSATPEYRLFQVAHDTVQAAGRQPGLGIALPRRAPAAAQPGAGTRRHRLPGLPARGRCARRAATSRPTRPTPRRGRRCSIGSPGCGITPTASTRSKRTSARLDAAPRPADSTRSSVSWRSGQRSTNSRPRTSNCSRT